MPGDRPIPTPTATSTATPTATSTPTPTSTGTDAQPVRDAAETTRARVAAVEAKVEAALDGLEARVEAFAARAGVPSAADLRDAVARLLPRLLARLSGARELLHLREPPDPFGMDPRLAEWGDALIEFLYATYWRVEVRHAARVPSAGPAIVVANHAGVVPWDALVLRHALRRDHPAHRELRPLLDARECDLPLVGGAAVRLGAVRASPEAAARILAAGDVVGVFPEGSAGARKAWSERYRIQRFGRGGFVKVALRAGAPIVPCAIVGSEEAAPAISRAGWLADRLGLSALGGSGLLSIGAAGALPLPSKWTLRFADPVEVRDRGPAAADNPGAVMELTEQVRSTVQQMLDEDVAARRSIFL